jgi:hypothetical protein
MVVMVAGTPEDSMVEAGEAITDIMVVIVDTGGSMVEVSIHTGDYGDGDFGDGLF